MKSRSLKEVAENIDSGQIESALKVIVKKLKNLPEESLELQMAIGKILVDFDKNKSRGTALLFLKLKAIQARLLKQPSINDFKILKLIKKHLYEKFFDKINPPDFEKEIEKLLGGVLPDYNIETVKKSLKADPGRYAKTFMVAAANKIEKLTATKEVEDLYIKPLFSSRDSYEELQLYSNAYPYSQAPTNTASSSSTTLVSSSSVSPSSAFFSNTASSSTSSSSSVPQGPNQNSRVDYSQGVFADMLNDMNKAKNHILIVGWALSPVEKFGPNRQTLPQVIAKKALEGKKIVLLIWRNFTPEFDGEIKLFANCIKKEIEELSKNTKIYSIEQYQNAENNIKIEYSAADELGVSHHQKMLVIDDILYIGGLDLTTGRSDPDTWHDCHARVKGPVVEDAIVLIRARWETIKNKQRKKEGLEILTNAEAYNNVIKSKNPSSQASSSSASNQPTMRLICTIKSEHADIKSINGSNQNKVTEIHKTYCNAIKKAQNFIYMENQFFVGTRFIGVTTDIRESKNQVIRAILDKIVEKISNQEPFHFYCQLPYRPEGVEKAFHVQTILRKQWTTMAWLINEVHQAIEIQKAIGLLGEDTTVANYITFYNLGHYDTEDKYQMKYTHSKLLIVDDKELIVGSANCNARSMTGKKDSEVAIHIQGTGSGAVDKIKNYRVELMQEHFGCPPYLDPATEYKQIQATLQINLDNLEQPSARFKPRATPWGNIPLAQLYNAQNPGHDNKPGHVPDKSPIKGNIVDNILGFKLSG